MRIYKGTMRRRLRKNLQRWGAPEWDRRRSKISGLKRSGTVLR